MSRLTCVEVVELVTDHLEGALTGEDLAAFVEHLEGCDGCETYVAQIRATMDLLGDQPGAPLPPAAEDRLVDMFRTWHRDRSGR